MSLPGTWAGPFRDAGCTAIWAQCATYIGRLTPRSSIMQRLMPTAQTTLLPASTPMVKRSAMAANRKCLQSNPRLDDRRQPVSHSAMNLFRQASHLRRQRGKGFSRANWASARETAAKAKPIHTLFRPRLDQGAHHIPAVHDRSEQRRLLSLLNSWDSRRCHCGTASATFRLVGYDDSVSHHSSCRCGSHQLPDRPDAPQPAWVQSVRRSRTGRSSPTLSARQQIRSVMRVTDARYCDPNLSFADMPPPVSIPFGRHPHRNHPAGQISAFGRDAPCRRTIAPRRPTRDASHGRTSHRYMSMWTDPGRLTD